MSATDVIVVGGNADGLTVAAILARSGYAVTVVDSALKVGGELSTESFLTPYRFNLHGGHLLTREISPLATLGIAPPAWLNPDVVMAVTFAQGPPLLLRRALSGLQSQLPPADYRNVLGLAEFGAQWAALLASRLRHESVQTPSRIATLAGYNVRQLLDHFALNDERLRCALSYLPLAFGLSIEAPGSGLAVPLLLHGLSTLTVVDGGAGMLSAALQDSFISDGARVLEGVGVGRITSEAGAVTGVVLSNGTQLSARTVICADPATLTAWTDDGRSDQSMSRADALGIYRYYVGAQGGGLSFAGEHASTLDQAYMIVRGFDNEAAIYAHLKALREGEFPPPAGHFIASGYLDPKVSPGVSTPASVGGWRLSCHTETGVVQTGSVARSFIWQGLLPMAPRVSDPDGFRRQLAARCLRHAESAFSADLITQAFFQLVWLPQDTGEYLQHIDWPTLADADARTLSSHYQTKLDGLLCDPLSHLSLITGLATGASAASAIMHKES